MNPWKWLESYAAMPERLIIGLMSGTSVDGVDAALVRVSGTGRQTEATLVAYCETPFPDDLRAAVLALSHGHGDPASLSRANVGLGYLFANAANAVRQKVGVSPGEVSAIASHGQTVSHTPYIIRYSAARPVETGATLQIGDAAVIAAQTGVPVVSDFRTMDLALGGQGAPLVPYADWCLLTHPTQTRAVQNIGGIGNVTYLPANANASEVRGFDTGPGNMLIDRAVAWATENRERYDADGRRAAQGRVMTDVLEHLLCDDFLRYAPPKSAGREEFGESYWELLLRGHEWMREEAADVVATLTAFTAYSIADAYERHLPRMPDVIILGGGGARNPILRQLLANKVAPVPVLVHEDLGINSDSKEAVAFAILANETLQGNPSNLPSVTGASRPAVLGKITLP